jgi:microcystin-dependent protein
VDVFTVTRAQDGTAARTFTSGARVSLNLTAAVIAELVELDGTSATGTWPISISGVAASATAAVSSTTQAPGTSNTSIATTAFVAANSSPSGAINMWPTATPPLNWLICNGQAISRTTFATLFAILGTTFGVGDGSTTFNVPNYVDRMPIGSGNLYPANAQGGSRDAVIPTHTHTITDPGHSHAPPTDIYGLTGFVTGMLGHDGAIDGSSTVSPYDRTINNSNTATATTGVTVNSTGVSATNANMPPYLGIYFIIKT